MKRFAFICIFILLIHYSVQIPKYENCDRQVLKGDAAKDCVKVTCMANKKDFNLQGCDSVECKKGKQVGYHNGDRNDEFPGCCSYPICQK